MSMIKSYSNIEDRSGSYMRKSVNDLTYSLNPTMESINTRSKVFTMEISTRRMRMKTTKTL